MNVFQQVADGITSGSIYGALALALVLVYRATGMVNFAQGQMAVVGGYLAVSLINAGLPVVLGIALAVVATALLGALLERTLIRRFEGGDPLVTVVVTVAVLVCLNGIVSYIWGADLKAFPAIFPSGRLSLGPARFTTADVGTVLVISAVIGSLWLLFQRTRFGLAMRAVAQNPESAAQSGLPVSVLLMTGWALAAGVGTIACCLLAPSNSLEPNMMDPILVYALAAAILGGLDSPLGAVAAAWTIGVVQNLAGAYIDVIGNDLQVMVPMALMAAILLVRPQGVFGRREVVRV